MTRSHFLVLLLPVLAATGCASTSANLTLAAAHGPPVGAALVPQPRMSTDPVLKLDLSAYYVSEPAQVTARLRVEPDARSRSLTIEWWTEDGVGGSHLIALEGDRAAIRHTYPIKRLAQGAYVVTAVLQRNDGTSVRRQRRMLVLSETGATPSGLGIADEPIW